MTTVYVMCIVWCFRRTLKIEFIPTCSNCINHLGIYYLVWVTLRNDEPNANRFQRFITTKLSENRATQRNNVNREREKRHFHFHCDWFANNRQCETSASNAAVLRRAYINSQLELHGPPNAPKEVSNYWVFIRKPSVNIDLFTIVLISL